MVPRNIPITRTKILVPRRRADLLTRQRLLELMDEMLEYRLILVTAPAGYGKTSLLIDTVQKTKMPVCWLALDPLDKDPQRFIAHFIASIRQVYPSFGEASISALREMPQDQLSLQVMVSLIVNEALENISEHFLFILDDFHLVEESQPVLDFINDILIHADENFHLLIASRRLLTLPDLTLMVARSQVSGLGVEELVFRSEEIKALFLQNYRITISDAQADEMVQETEGWITGVLLSTQMRGGEFSPKRKIHQPTGIGLYDYLAQQALVNQPPEVQEFLLRTSLLDEFNSTLCEQVIGSALGIQANWNQLMDSVLRNNLFVLPLVEDQVWLRYHHLFRDFLRNQMVTERKEEWLLIQKRLADYYQSTEDWQRAFDIYQRIGDVHLQAKLIEDAGLQLIANGQLITLQNWLDSLPDSYVDENPSLLCLNGSVIAMRGHPQEGIDTVNQALEILDPLNIPLKALTLNRRSVAYRMLGNYEASIRDANSVIQLASQHSELEPMFKADAYLYKGTSLYYQGNLRDALVAMQEALSIYQGLQDLDTSAKIYMEIAMVRKNMGDYAIAEELYQKSLSYYQQKGNVVWQANVLNNLGVLYHLLGDYEKALDTFEKSIHYAQIGGYPRLEAYALTSLGDLFKEIDLYREAGEAYQKAKQLLVNFSDRFLLFYLTVARALLYLSQGKNTSSVEQLEQAKILLSESQSQYEANYWILANSEIYLKQQKFDLIIDQLPGALAFFEGNGQRVEAVRSRQILAFAYYQTYEVQKALNEINQNLKYFEYKDQQHILIVSARLGFEILQEWQLSEGSHPDLSDLIEVTHKLINRIPRLKKSLRQRSKIVPLSPPELHIYCLGANQVKIGDHVITNAEWQAQTARDLLFIILAHPEGITKEKIMDTFWPEDEIEDVRLRFKNAIYRLRRALGTDAIIFKDELYIFNRDIDFEADVETFQKEIQLAKIEPQLDNKITHFKNAIHTYRGPYLPELSDYWVVIEREKLHQSYINAVVNLAGLFLEARKYVDAVEVVQGVLRDDPCFEPAHRIAMRAYAAQGNQAGVVRQYEICRRALLDEYGAAPSEQTRKLYDTLIREDIDLNY